jgi:hypothetical protein
VGESTLCYPRLLVDGCGLGVVSRAGVVGLLRAPSEPVWPAPHRPHDHQRTVPGPRSRPNLLTGQFTQTRTTKFKINESIRNQWGHHCNHTNDPR